MEKRRLAELAAAGALGAGVMYAAITIPLQECFKEQVVDGVKTIICKDRLSCTPHPPWNSGCPGD
jgi:hypothetical protein